MNELPILAAILTVAVQQRPERQQARVGGVRGNIYQTIMTDYKELLSHLTTHHPELRKNPSGTQC
jgi:hypothetical protein